MLTVSGASALVLVGVLGHPPGQEADTRINDDRRAECTAAAERIEAGDFRPGDANTRLLETCRWALLAERVLEMVPTRTGSDISDDELTVGIDAAHQILVRFNENGGRGGMANEFRLDALRVALMAEACLAQADVDETIAEAARGLLERFHRSPDNPQYSVVDPRVLECGSRYDG